jgi:hypothetical protein
MGDDPDDCDPPVRRAGRGHGPGAVRRRRGLPADRPPSHGAAHAIDPLAPLLPFLVLVVPASFPAQWVLNGRQIGPDPYYGDIPPIVADDQGGAFVFWSQSLSPVVGIHLQHLDAHGLNTWTNDVFITPVTLDKAMVADGSGGVGGAIVAWGDLSTAPAVFAQRITEDAWT